MRQYFQKNTLQSKRVKEEILFENRNVYILSLYSTKKYREFENIVLKNIQKIQKSEFE